MALVRLRDSKSNINGLSQFQGSHRNPNTPAVTVIAYNVRAKRSCTTFQSCSSIPLPNPSRDTINQANARLTSSYSDSRTLPPIKHKTRDCHGLFNSPAIARQISQAAPLIGFTAMKFWSSVARHTRLHRQCSHSIIPEKPSQVPRLARTRATVETLLQPNSVS